MRGRVKVYIKKLRNSKPKGKHKIGCYPKSLQRFTAYQVQGRCSMILSSVKYQPYGSNVSGIILKSSFRTHLKHYSLYTYILHKLKKPPYGFCTHILFDSAIILIFGGIFLHRLSRILKFNIKWLRVPTTEFSRQKCITRRYHPNSSKPIWKARKSLPNFKPITDPLFPTQFLRMVYTT